ncbi:hypothetical protein SSS_08200 [Sarcoptes scabiei]|uniref:Atg14-like protein n=1 Tax=Sarcoptes scabiei TaxID=52283 RepID=A0A131ZUI2_SARSC|nr:hypothetical protein SSS_08200 [Sarcoptes scabiei]KPL94076.1 Atg14-like protein [Sarcoptes scabiei]
MLQTIRDRIQQDLTKSLRNLTFNLNRNSSGGNSDETFRDEHQYQCDNYNLDVNLDAGCEFIYYFQENWSKIKTQSTENVKKAQTIDNHLTDLNNDFEKFLENISQFDQLYEHLLPEITSDLDIVENELKMTNKMIDEMQKLILEMQKNNLRKRFDQQRIESIENHNKILAMKSDSLAKYESDLFQKKELRKLQELQERQSVFQEAFEDEIRTYKKKNSMRNQHQVNDGGVDGYLQNFQSKLEEISIEIDQNDADELEKFLSDI